MPILKAVGKRFRSWFIIDAKNTDLPEPLFPKIERRSGGRFSSSTLGINKWHRGQAKSRQSSPSSSMAAQSAVKRVGKKRRNSFGFASRGSPAKFTLPEIYKTSSGGNLCQQFGHSTSFVSSMPAWLLLFMLFTHNDLIAWMFTSITPWIKSHRFVEVAKFLLKR